MSTFAVMLNRRSRLFGLRQAGVLALLAIAAPTVATLTAAPPAGATPGCDLVASPTGSDAASGAVTTPFRTAQRLIDALAAGQTGCLRGGTYAESLRFNHGGATGAPVTITSYPVERATVVGRLYVPSGSNNVTISGLSLDGTNASALPSPTVNSSDVTFTGNDVTNQHTAICFALGEEGWGTATRVTIERNRIHGCGRLPATNHDHGIYVDKSSAVTISWNLIYDSSDRGINLYPDAQNTTITHNVIDGNGEGVLFSGDFGLASSNNTVANNVISNAVLRHGVESWYPTGNPVGQANVVQSNCVWGGAMSVIDTSAGGFTEQANTLADPQFANRAGGDFAMAPTSLCAAIAGDVQGTVDGTSAVIAALPPLTAVTAAPSLASVTAGSLSSGTAADLAAADLAYYSVSSGRRTQVAAFTASFLGVPATLSGLQLGYQGSVTAPCTQTVSLFRFATGAWTDLDLRSVDTTEQARSGLVPPGSASEYVSTAGEVRARVRCSSAPTKLTLNGNLIQLTYSRS